jgi:hypothetical protein
MRTTELALRGPGYEREEVLRDSSRTPSFNQYCRHCHHLQGGSGDSKLGLVMVLATGYDSGW